MAGSRLVLWQAFRKYCSSSLKALVSNDVLQPGIHDLSVVLEQHESGIVEQLNQVQPMLPVHSSTIAPFVNQSDVLKSLLSLGVNLSRLEKYPAVAERLLKMNNLNDIEAHMFFLRDCGVKDNVFGQVINRYPKLLLNDIEALNCRVLLLRSYGFPLTSIATIVTRTPNVFELNAESISKRLDIMQQEFAMSSEEVITAISKCPRLLLFESDKLSFNKVALKEMAGFSETDLKAMLLTAPRIFTGSKKHMIAIYDFLAHVMDVKRSMIVQFPQIFRSRLRNIEQRHQFLVQLGRNQYDPKLPNYVSLFHLVSGSDQEFVEKIAKSTIDSYNLFLKTL